MDRETKGRGKKRFLWLGLLVESERPKTVKKRHYSHFRATLFPYRKLSVSSFYPHYSSMAFKLLLLITGR